MWRRLIYHPEINYALRQTLVLCLPVVIGLLLGHLQIGLLFSLVPACCNVAGLDTPHKRFFKRLIIGGLLFAFSGYLMQQFLLWHIPLPLILLILALLLGVNAEISPLHSRLLPAALVAAILTLSVSDKIPIWQTSLLYIIGTTWYGLATWFWFRLWQEQPMRETLSLLYRELADYFEAKYTLLTQHTDPETALPPLLQRQQKVMDLITQLYQQLYMISDPRSVQHKRLMRTFQVALDLQEHITVSLHLPDEVQKLVQQSHAEAIIRRNAQVIAKRLRVLSDSILYHHNPAHFSMENELAALEKLASQTQDNPVGQFCFYHFSRIGRLLRTQRPLYRRTLLDNQQRLPFWPAFANYLSLKSTGLRNASRMGVTLAIGSGLGMLFDLPKPYWILLTIMFVSQNGYNATRVRIQHRAIGTMAGLVVAAGILQLKMPQSEVLTLMLVITLISYLWVRKNYGLAMVGFTVTAVYTLQLLTLQGADFLLPRLVDTVIGCVLAFASMIWLWPQWQSGLLRKNAHQALEEYQNHIQLLLAEEPDITNLSHTRMKANQAHNTLFNSLNQAMQEPGFNSGYLTDMRLWVTHSQFIVEHLNAMTILARDHYMLPPEKAANYLMACEIALQSCQQRLEYDGPGNETTLLAQPELDPSIMPTLMERHLRRMLSHLQTMHTISSLAWRERPHHGIWLKRKLRDNKS